MPTSTEPRVVVLCRCGAQWFGAATVDNPVIAAHAAECGPPIGVWEFVSLGNVVRWPPEWDFPARRKALKAVE